MQGARHFDKNFKMSQAYKIFIKHAIPFPDFIQMKN